MTLPCIHAQLDAKARAIRGDELTVQERLTAAHEFARDLTCTSFNLRHRDVHGPRAAADQLRTVLSRHLAVASSHIQDASRTILPTRTAVFRSGGLVAPTAHEMALSLGWRCRDTTQADGWPDQNELLAEIDLEYAQAMTPLKASAPAGGRAEADRPKGRRKTGRPKATEKDADSLVVAALNLHHGYDGRSVTNTEPATNRGLAKAVNKEHKRGRVTISENALTRFLKRVGMDGKRYKVSCRDGSLRIHLASWNRDLSSRFPKLRNND